MTPLRNRLFGIIVVNGENAGNQHFLRLPTMFLYSIKKKLHHLSHNEIVVCKCCQFGQGKNFVVCKRDNFNPFRNTPY